MFTYQTKHLMPNLLSGIMLKKNANKSDNKNIPNVNKPNKKKLQNVNKSAHTFDHVTHQNKTKLQSDQAALQK